MDEPCSWVISGRNQGLDRTTAGQKFVHPSTNRLPLEVFNLCGSWKQTQQVTTKSLFSQIGQIGLSLNPLREADTRLQQQPEPAQIVRVLSRHCTGTHPTQVNPYRRLISLRPCPRLLRYNRLFWAVSHALGPHGNHRPRYGSIPSEPGHRASGEDQQFHTHAQRPILKAMSQA